MTSRQDMYTRDDLRGLYAKTQEEVRLKRVAQIVKDICDRLVHAASHSPMTTFSYPLPARHTSGNPQNDQRQNEQLDFYLTNMSDIVTGLMTRFPESIITQKSIIRTRDGTDHDISTIDPKIISLLGGQRMEAIVIDWS
jgi:hypothetical protein